MSRINQFYRLHKEAKSELWTADQPWCDLGTAEESRERQKRHSRESDVLKLEEARRQAARDNIRRLRALRLASNVREEGIRT
jgi:hypothetical protein